MRLHIATVIFLILENLTKAYAQGAPMNPCPRIFQYRFNGAEWWGVLAVPNSQIGQPLILHITLSMRGLLQLNYHGEIQLLTRGKYFSDEPVFYKIIFPNSHVPPKLIQIKVNNQILCLGPPDFNIFVTQIQLEHTRTFTFLPYEMISRFVPATAAATGPGGGQSPEEMPVFSPPPQPTNTAFNTKHLPLTNKEKSPMQSLKESCGTIDDRIDFHVFQALKQSRTASTSSEDYADTVESLLADRRNDKLKMVEKKQVGKIRRPLIVSNISDDSRTSESKHPSIAHGAWPWLAAVYVNNLTSLAYRCGGTLVSSHVVISAAHCFQLFNQYYAAKDVLVFLGRHNLLNWSEDSSIAAPVDEIYTHPNFNKNLNSFDADIAVLIVKTEIRFNSFIRPACLWSGPTEPEFMEGEQGVVVGWSTGSEYFPTLTSVPKIFRAPIVSDNVCFQANPQYESLSSHRTFCAGIVLQHRNKMATDHQSNVQEETYQGPCTGDSGAGLMIFKNDRWMLRGLVSGLLPLQPNEDTTSSPSCSINQYVIYTDVAQFLDWVVAFFIA